MTSADAPVATVIGDIVDSRRAPDRQALHHLLVRGLVPSSDHDGVVESLAVVAGDEFQGRYTTVEAAVVATLRVRLALAPDIDVRFGIGWGPVAVLDPTREPVVQDGPGWWAARAAIEDAERRMKHAATRTTRTRYASMEAGGDTWVNALLAARDLTVAGLSDRSRRLLAGGLSGVPQTLMADQEGISQSAVSQTMTRDGLGALVELHRALLARPS